MKKILLSLVVCGLSIGGTGYGLDSSPLKKTEASRNNFVEVKSAEDAREDNSAEVVNNIEEFCKDFEKVCNNEMSGMELANKYGTEKGRVYKVGDTDIFLKKYKEGDGYATRWCFLKEFSKEAEESSAVSMSSENKAKKEEASFIELESLQKKENPVVSSLSKELKKDFSSVFNEVMPSISVSRNLSESLRQKDSIFSRSLDGVFATARDSLFFGLYTVCRTFLDAVARNLSDLWIQSLIGVSVRR